MTFSDTIAAEEVAFENWFAETEVDVQSVITAFGKGLTVVESAITSALGWVAKETPTIVPILEGVLAFAAPMAATPGVGVAVAAAQLAITELNTVAQAQNTGMTSAQTLLAAYTAYTQAQAAAAAVKVATVQAVAAK